MIRRYYYTLADFDGQVLLPDPGNKDSGYAKRNNRKFSDVLNYRVNATITGDTDSEAIKVYQEYIWPRHYNESLYFIDKYYERWQEPEVPTITEQNTAAESISGAVWAWWTDSKAKYIPIIKMYAAQANNLLNKIETTSTTKFNDTPQDGGNFSTDEHTTNSTRVVSGTDATTLINRLDEIRRKLTTVYEEWAQEFERFLIGD